MAGYFTDKRNLPRSSNRCVTYKNGVVTNNTGGDDRLYSGNRIPTQETTSWRTGRLAVGETNYQKGEEKLLLSGGTLASSTRALRALEPIEDTPTEDYRGPHAVKGRHDSGHTFSTEKLTCMASYLNISAKVGADLWRFTGPVGISSAIATGYPSLPSYNPNYWGPLAIHLTIPTNPNVNLMLTLSELRREGLPSLPGMSLSGNTVTPRSIAGEHLNYQFGVAPLISDVKGVLKSVKESSKILTQFQRDSDRVVRRKHVFQPIRTTAITNASSAVDLVSMGTSSIGTGQFFVGGGAGGASISFTRTLTQTTEIWFSGAYVYHIWNDDSFNGQIRSFEQKANHLLGIRFNADTLWNLGPWSWLLDWKYNIGINISNAEALSSDGLVLKYGYLMVKRTARYDYHWWSNNVRKDTGSPASGVFSMIREKKERIRANPYGFASNPNSFSVRQWGILGALGLTKSPRGLF